MTINEAVAKVSASIGESLSRNTLVGWLSEIENTVINEIAATHEGMEYTREIVTAETDGDRELFVPDPYSVLYLHYLIMKCDDSMYDTERYMNSAARFNASYSSFADWYNRTYMPYSQASISV